MAPFQPEYAGTIRLESAVAVPSGLDENGMTAVRERYHALLDKTKRFDYGDFELMFFLPLFTSYLLKVYIFSISFLVEFRYEMRDRRRAATVADGQRRIEESDESETP